MMFQNNADFKLILSTAPDLDVARSIARELVESRLAACVNVLPGVESVYRWEGRVESGAEVLLVIKASASCLPETLERLASLHPYQVPEGIVLPIEGGLEKYLAWLGESLRRDCDSLG